MGRLGVGGGEGEGEDGGGEEVGFGVVPLALT